MLGDDESEMLQHCISPPKIAPAVSVTVLGVIALIGYCSDCSELVNVMKVIT